MHQSTIADFFPVVKGPVNYDKSAQLLKPIKAADSCNKYAQDCGTDNIPADARPFPLMRLPVELRIMIYKELGIVTKHNWHESSERTDDPLYGTGAPISTKEGKPKNPRDPLGFTTVRFILPLQLLRTCRQVYSEAMPILIPKRELIRKMVPKIIAYTRDDKEHGVPRGLGFHINTVGFWHDMLLANPNADFANFAKLKPRVAPHELRQVQQSGMQLLPRYRNVQRSAAGPVTFFQVQCRITRDGPKLTCPCEREDPEDLTEEEHEIQENLEYSATQLFDAVMRSASRRLQPMDHGNPVVKLGMRCECGCPDPTVFVTLNNAWVPRGQDGTYTPSDEEREWNKFEKKSGWVDGEILEEPMKGV